MSNDPEHSEFAAFLQGRIDIGGFDHTDHVRMGFKLLRKASFPMAAAAYSGSLKRMAARAGQPNAYHETITLAFLSLIGERSATSEHVEFDTLARANPDLLERSALMRWYAPERLHCNLARRTFLLPDHSHE